MMLCWELTFHETCFLKPLNIFILWEFFSFFLILIWEMYVCPTFKFCKGFVKKTYMNLSVNVEDMHKDR